MILDLCPVVSVAKAEPGMWLAVPAMTVTAMMALVVFVVAMAMVPAVMSAMRPVMVLAMLIAVASMPRFMASQCSGTKR